MPVSRSQAPLLVLVSVRSGWETEAEIEQEHAAVSGAAVSRQAMKRKQRAVRNLSS